MPLKNLINVINNFIIKNYIRIKMSSTADVCKKFYASYYELNSETQKKLAELLREIHTCINPVSVREQTHSISINDEEVSQYERIVSVVRILCPTIVSIVRDTPSTQKLMFHINWKGQFIVPNQFCNSKTEPFVVRLRGKMSEWQTVEIPEVKSNHIQNMNATTPISWLGRLRNSGYKETTIKTKTKPIIVECDLVHENNELKKRIKQLEEKILQMFAD
jgi:hypothetical protein